MQRIKPVQSNSVWLNELKQHSIMLSNAVRISKDQT